MAPYQGRTEGCGVFHTNENWHKSSINFQLKEFISRDSFAWRLYKKIGSEIASHLDIASEEDDNSLAQELPVEELFHLLMGGWRFDVCWLANYDGTYTDDNENLLPPTVEIVCTPTEQLAIYGLWLLEEELNSLGNIPESDINTYGWSRDQVQQHRAECLLQAYQALTYLLLLKIGKPLDTKELEKAVRAALAKKASEARHIENRSMKAEVFAWCDSHLLDSQCSMDDAAFAIAEKLVPVKFRTVRQWMTDWRKLQPPRKL